VGRLRWGINLGLGARNDRCATSLFEWEPRDTGRPSNSLAIEVALPLGGGPDELSRLEVYRWVVGSVSNPSWDRGRPCGGGSVP
jgi:hypothetical protein